jgi:hypothetical protein
MEQNNEYEKVSGASGLTRLCMTFVLATRPEKNRETRITPSILNGGGKSIGGTWNEAPMTKMMGTAG